MTTIYLICFGHLFKNKTRIWHWHQHQTLYSVAEAPLVAVTASSLHWYDAASFAYLDLRIFCWFQILSGWVGTVSVQLPPDMFEGSRQSSGCSSQDVHRFVPNTLLHRLGCMPRMTDLLEGDGAVDLLEQSLLPLEFSHWPSGLQLYPIFQVCLLLFNCYQQCESQIYSLNMSFVWAWLNPWHQRRRKFILNLTQLIRWEHYECGLFTIPMQSQ